MPFTTVRDIKVYYEIRGSGPRLLFIGGTGGDLRRKPNAFDRPIGEHFEVLAYDQRGLGQTEKPDVSYTMADYAEDAAALLTAVGWDRCLVLGASFGGMVAQELAVRHPDRVERLMLAITSSGGEGGSSYPLHELLDLPPEEAARRRIAVLDTRNSLEWQAEHPDEAKALVDGMRALQSLGVDEPGHQMGARRQLEARSGHDTYDRLPTLAMPVYVIGGLHDGAATPDVVRALADRIPGAKLDFFEGSHTSVLQASEPWNRIISFLQGATETVVQGT